MRNTYSIIKIDCDLCMFSPFKYKIKLYNLDGTWVQFAVRAHSAIYRLYSSVSSSQLFLYNNLDLHTISTYMYERYHHTDLDYTPKTQHIWNRSDAFAYNKTQHIIDIRVVIESVNSSKKSEEPYKRSYWKLSPCRHRVCSARYRGKPLHGSSHLFSNRSNKN